MHTDETVLIAVSFNNKLFEKAFSLNYEIIKKKADRNTIKKIIIKNYNSLFE